MMKRTENKMNKNLFCITTLYEHNGCKRTYEQQFQKRGRFNKINNLDATAPFYTNLGKTTKVITDLKKASMKPARLLA